MFESVAFVALETGEFWAPLYTAIEKFPTIYGNGIKVWPAAKFIAFNFVP